MVSLFSTGLSSAPFSPSRHRRVRVRPVDLDRCSRADRIFAQRARFRTAADAMRATAKRKSAMEII